VINLVDDLSYKTPPAQINKPKEVYLYMKKYIVSIKAYIWDYFR